MYVNLIIFTVLSVFRQWMNFLILETDLLYVVESISSLDLRGD